MSSYATVNRLDGKSPRSYRCLENKHWSSTTARTGQNTGCRQNGRSSCDATAPIRLTVVGRLSPRKGQDIAVQALAEIISTGADATLTLVGGVFPGYEWYEHELKQTAAKLGLADRVKFVGFQEDIRTVLASDRHRYCAFANRTFRDRGRRMYGGRAC